MYIIYVGKGLRLLSPLVQKGCVHGPNQIESRVAKLPLMLAALVGLRCLYCMTKRQAQVK